MVCTVTPVLCADPACAYTGMHAMVCGQFLLTPPPPVSSRGNPSYRYMDLVCIIKTIIYPG